MIITIGLIYGCCFGFEIIDEEDMSGMMIELLIIRILFTRDK